MAAPTAPVPDTDTPPTRPPSPTTPTPTAVSARPRPRARTWSVRVVLGAGIIVGLLGWMLGLALVMVPGEGAEGAVDPATAYGTRGPHSVGLRNIDRAETTGTLDLVMWYPAEPTDAKSAMTYPFEFKLFGPLGSVALATAEAPPPAVPPPIERPVHIRWSYSLRAPSPAPTMSSKCSTSSTNTAHGAAPSKG